MLEQGFIYCFLLYPPTPCILLLPRSFRLVPLRKTLCQRQERGLLFCFSATYIYLFIPLIAIMMPIHSYHNSPAFSADGWRYLQPSREKRGKDWELCQWFVELVRSPCWQLSLFSLSFFLFSFSVCSYTSSFSFPSQIWHTGPHSTFALHMLTNCCDVFLWSWREIVRRVNLEVKCEHRSLLYSACSLMYTSYH